MLSKYNKLLAYLKYLNIKPDVDNFNSGFRIQKIVFLLKSMDLNIDYNFKPGSMILIAKCWQMTIITTKKTSII